MDIRWDNPEALYGLWLLLPIGALLAWAQARKRRAAGRFADASMRGRIMPHVSGAYPWMRGATLLAAFACLAIAAPPYPPGSTA